ncbi:MAG: hypothetical protein IKO42_04540, partial [Opitutales bacterium]|nr:hypothetical protein [Opitutales bacterium]
GLITIEAYRGMFADNMQLYNKLRDDAFKAFPEDFQKAAKQFEAQSQMIIEIDALPRSSKVDADLFYGIKSAANKKFPNEYKKQKEYVEGILNIFAEYELLAGQKQREEKARKANPASRENREAYQKTLVKSLVFIEGEKSSGLGIITEVKGKTVVLFPSECYDVSGVAIKNNLDEQITYTEILGSKTSPFMLAIVKDMPEGMQPVEMPKTDDIKNYIQKPAFVFTFEEKSAYLRGNQILSMKNDSLNLESAMTRGANIGTSMFKFDEGGKPMILSMQVNEYNNVAIPDFTNKIQVKEFEKNFSKPKAQPKMARVDEINNWAKIDSAKFAEQAQMLNDLKEANKNYMAFFTASSFNVLSSHDWFKGISDKYSEPFFKQKLDESSHKKLVKNMLMEVASIMKKDASKIKADSIIPILQPEFAKQLQIRKAMVDTLENAFKKDTINRFIFDDISLKKR